MELKSYFMAKPKQFFISDWNMGERTDRMESQTGHSPLIKQQRESAAKKNTWAGDIQLLFDSFMQWSKMKGAFGYVSHEIVMMVSIDRRVCHTIYLIKLNEFIILSFTEKMRSNRS